MSRMAVEVNELTHEDFSDFETMEFESPEYVELATHVKENDSLPDLKVDAGKVYKKKHLIIKWMNSAKPPGNYGYLSS